MTNALVQLVLAQFKEFVREPGVLFWGFIFPILIAGILGLAFMQRPDIKSTVAVVGEREAMDTPLQRRLDSLNKAEGFHLIYLSKEEALAKVRRGEIALYMEETGDGEAVFHYDPVNNDARMQYLSITNALLSPGNDQFREAHITARGNRYIDFLVPGLIAMGIMNSCLWGIGWNLIDYRIKKLMRRMVATPMKKSVFLLALFISRGVLLLIEASIIVAFAYFAFDVTIQGSVPAFFMVFLSGLTAFAGLAALMASRARHSQVGNGLINAITLPMIILSGIFFSYQNFPDWVVAMVRFLPLSILADALRAVFNEEAGVAESLFEAGALLLLGVGFFFAGLKIFKWH